MLPLQLGQHLELNITGLTHQGFGVGRYQGFTVFVPGALSGETVKVRIKELKKNFAVAEIVDILDCSIYRISPRCKVFHQCGGCHLQHAEYLHQLEVKQQTVKNTIHRIAKLDDVQVRPVLGITDPWHYRNNIQFHLTEYQGQAQMGFYSPGTNQLVPVEQCHLLPAELNDIAFFFLSLVRELDIPVFQSGHIQGLKHMVLRTSRSLGETVLVLVTSALDMPGLPEITQRLMHRFPRLVSVVQNVNPSKTSQVFGPEFKALGGKGKIADRLSGIDFFVSPGSFVQVNPAQTEVLYQQVLNYARLTGQQTVVDVYSGIGVLSLLLAKNAQQLYGIEVVPEAVADAKANAHLNNITNAFFEAGLAEVLLPKMAEQGIKPDIIVIDPPRKGCDPAVLNAIATMSPLKVIYVSCDPATLARDLRVLTDLGFQCREVQPVDMFPQTYHVECVVSLKRKHSL